MDENFLVVLDGDRYFRDVIDNQVTVTNDRDKAARLTQRSAIEYMKRLRMRGWRQARVEPVDGPASTEDEAARIRDAWFGDNR